MKKGTATAGVQRQYTGTAGRIENAQVAVYLTYVAPAGHALIDRELYLPRSWIADPGRCRAAGIPEGTAFATKPALARRMLARTLDAGVPAGWLPAMRSTAPTQACGLTWRNTDTRYVLAVACRHMFTTGLRASRADELARRLPRPAWQRYSAGAGAKGHRYYDWAWVSTDPGQPGHRWLLSAATGTPENWPSTAATRPGTSRWPPWSRSPGSDGPSRRTSRPARA